MAKRVPTASVIVIRKDESTGKNKRVSPPLGKSFDFTADEISDINRVHPGALRKPVNETAADEGHTSDDSEAGRKASSQTAPEGNKTATAADGTKTKAKKANKERAKTAPPAADTSETDDEVAEDAAEDADDDATDEDEDI